jgi:hypothetical protein
VDRPTEALNKEPTMKNALSAQTALLVANSLFTEIATAIIDAGVITRGELANRLAYTASQQADQDARVIVAGIADHLRFFERSED